MAFTTDKLYKRILTFLIASDACVTNINYNHLSTLTHLSFFIVLAIFFISLLFDLFKTFIVYDYIYICFLFLLIFFTKSSFVFSAVSFALALMYISFNNVISIYTIVTIVQLIVGFITGISGITPMHDNLTNILTFGFINENPFAMLLTYLSVYLLISFNGKSFSLHWQCNKVFFLLFVICVNVFYFKDYTALFFLIFLLLVFYFKKIITKWKIVQIMIVVLPIITAWFSFWAASHYSSLSSNWLNMLDKITSGRLNIWSYYSSHYTLQLFSNLKIDDRIFNGTLDGSYIYIGFVYGIFILSVIVLGLVFANFRLLKNKQFLLLAFMISLEISGFSEALLVNMQTNFAISFALLAFFPSWIYYDGNNH